MSRHDPPKRPKLPKYGALGRLDAAFGAFLGSVADRARDLLPDEEKRKADAVTDAAIAAAKRKTARLKRERLLFQRATQVQQDATRVATPAAPVKRERSIAPRSVVPEYVEPAPSWDNIKGGGKVPGSGLLAEALKVGAQAGVGVAEQTANLAEGAIRMVPGGNLALDPGGNQKYSGWGTGAVVAPPVGLQAMSQGLSPTVAGLQDLQQDVAGAPAPSSYPQMGGRIGGGFLPIVGLAGLGGSAAAGRLAGSAGLRGLAQGASAQIAREGIALSPFAAQAAHDPEMSMLSLAAEHAGDGKMGDFLRGAAEIPAARGGAEILGDLLAGHAVLGAGKAIKAAPRVSTRATDFVADLADRAKGQEPSQKGARGARRRIREILDESKPEAPKAPEAPEEEMVTLHRYGNNDKLDVLSPKDPEARTGVGGREDVRRKLDGDEFLPRLNFYKEGVKPEYQVVGRNKVKYTAEVPRSQIATPDQTAEIFRSLPDGTASQREAAVVAAGYRGYEINKGYVVVFDDVSPSSVTSPEGTVRDLRPLEKIPAGEERVRAAFGRIEKQGGGTLAGDDTLWNEPGHFVPALRSKIMPAGDVTDEVLKAWRQENAPLFDRYPDAKVGAYKMSDGPHKGEWVLEVSLPLRDKDEAVKLAARGDEEAVWSTDAFDVIPVGGSGGAGLKRSVEDAVRMVEETGVTTPRTKLSDKPEFKEYQAGLERKRDARLEQVRQVFAKQDPDYADLKRPVSIMVRENQAVVLHRQPGGQIRATRMSPWGPDGHSLYKTVDKAVEDISFHGTLGDDATAQIDEWVKGDKWQQTGNQIGPESGAVLPEVARMAVRSVVGAGVGGASGAAIGTGDWEKVKKYALIGAGIGGAGKLTTELAAARKASKVVKSLTNADQQAAQRVAATISTGNNSARTLLEDLKRFPDRAMQTMIESTHLGTKKLIRSMIPTKKAATKVTKKLAQDLQESVGTAQGFADDATNFMKNHLSPIIKKVGDKTSTYLVAKQTLDVAKNEISDMVMDGMKGVDDRLADVRKATRNLDPEAAAQAEAQAIGDISRDLQEALLEKTGLDVGDASIRNAFSDGIPTDMAKRRELSDIVATVLMDETQGVAGWKSRAAIDDHRSVVANVDDETLTVAASYYDYNHRLLEKLWRAGAISEEGYQEALRRGQVYTSLRRVFKEELGPEWDAIQSAHGGKDAQSGLAARKAGIATSDVLDPVQSAILQTYAVSRIVAKQQVSNAVAAIVKHMPEGQIPGIRKVPAGYKSKTGRVITFLEDGVEQSYEVFDKDVLRLFESNSSLSDSIVVKAAMIPKDLLRNMVTTTPAFVIANATRDFVYTGIQYGRNPKDLAVGTAGGTVVGAGVGALTGDSPEDIFTAAAVGAGAGLPSVVFGKHAQKTLLAMRDLIAAEHYRPLKPGEVRTNVKQVQDDKLWDLFGQDREAAVKNVDDFFESRGGGTGYFIRNEKDAKAAAALLRDEGIGKWNTFKRFSGLEALIEINRIVETAPRLARFKDAKKPLIEAAEKKAADALAALDAPPPAAVTDAAPGVDAPPSGPAGLLGPGEAQGFESGAGFTRQPGTPGTGFTMTPQSKALVPTPEGAMTRGGRAPEPDLPPYQGFDAPPQAAEVDPRKLIEETLEKEIAEANRHGAFEARNVSVDFARKPGDEAWALASRATAFHNPQIQGWAQMTRVLSKPENFAYGMAMITAPSLALWYVNRDNPSYQALSSWVKNSFWVIPNFLPGVDSEFLYVPKPFELGYLFASLPERLADAAYASQQGDRVDQMTAKDTFKQLGEAAISGMAPNPTFQRGFTEIRRGDAGFDDFKDMPIEHAGYSASGDTESGSLATGLHNNPFTNAAGKLLGATSPAKWDHLLESYLGSWAKTGNKISTKAAKDLGWDSRPARPEERWTRFTDNKKAQSAPERTIRELNKKGEPTFREAMKLYEAAQDTEEGSREWAIYDRFDEKNRALLDDYLEQGKPRQQILDQATEDRRAVYRDPELSAKEKTEELELISEDTFYLLTEEEQ